VRVYCLGSRGKDIRQGGIERVLSTSARCSMSMSMSMAMAIMCVARDVPLRSGLMGVRSLERKSERDGYSWSSFPSRFELLPRVLCASRVAWFRRSGGVCLAVEQRRYVSRTRAALHCRVSVRTWPLAEYGYVDMYPQCICASCDIQRYTYAHAWASTSRFTCLRRADGGRPIALAFLNGNVARSAPHTYLLQASTPSNHPAKCVVDIDTSAARRCSVVSTPLRRVSIDPSRGGAPRFDLVHLVGMCVSHPRFLIPHDASTWRLESSRVGQGEELPQMRRAWILDSDMVDCPPTAAKVPKDKGGHGVRELVTLEESTSQHRGKLGEGQISMNVHPYCERTK